MKINKKPPFIVCLLGPTASGKTQLGYNIADTIPCEIISVDSAMIYNGMNIGTSKPDQDELVNYPHKLIDIIEPNEIYSVGDFLDNVQTEIERAIAKNKVPLLVGGTMMYFNALQNGIAKLPAANPEIRNKIIKDAETYGWETMHQKLQDIDPVSYQKLNPADTQRIQRALEVFYITHKPISDFVVSKPKYNFNSFYFGLFPQNRATLHETIAITMPWKDCLPTY